LTADKINDCDHSSDPSEQRTGYVSDHSDYQALKYAMGRAIGLWHKLALGRLQLVRRDRALDSHPMLSQLRDSRCPLLPGARRNRKGA
jgi:hypothetical protein